MPHDVPVLAQVQLHAFLLHSFPKFELLLGGGRGGQQPHSEGKKVEEVASVDCDVSPELQIGAGGAPSSQTAVFDVIHNQTGIVQDFASRAYLENIKVFLNLFETERGSCWAERTQHFGHHHAQHRTPPLAPAVQQIISGIEQALLQAVIMNGSLA